MSKPLSSLTDKALVREYWRTHAKIDKALTKLVEQGLGDVMPVVMFSKVGTLLPKFGKTGS